METKENTGLRDGEKVEEPKFTLDIEGALKPWDEDTITTEQIAALGGWDVSLGVLLIDKDNNERSATTWRGGEIGAWPGLFPRRCGSAAGSYAG